LRIGSGADRRLILPERGVIRLAHCKIPARCRWIENDAYVFSHFYRPFIWRLMARRENTSNRRKRAARQK
jgi:hypothetical protein